MLPKQQLIVSRSFSLYFVILLVIPRFQKLPKGWYKSYCFHTFASTEEKSCVHFKTNFSLYDNADLQIIRLKKTHVISRYPPRSFRKDISFNRKLISHILLEKFNHRDYILFPSMPNETKVNQLLWLL